MFRLVLWCCVLLAILIGIIDVYFRYVQPLAPRVDAAAATRVHIYDIHPLTYTQIPSLFRTAIVATEDRRFAWDPGVDPIGMVRSLFVDLSQQGQLQGGSTITQQLVDNTILNQDRTLRRKVWQIIDAIGLYDTMSKPRIFTLYTNMIYFGQNAYGLYNAAQTYFGRPPAALNHGELTLLAGLPNAPTLYDPFQSYALARARQKIVLVNMISAGVLTQRQALAIAALPIRLKYRR